MADRVPTLVILAGGSSSRLWPLREKSLIRFMDRPLLEHQLNTYVELGVKRVVVICNPDNQADIEQVLTNFGKKGQFWETTVQHQPRGMGDALLTLEPVLLANSSEPVPVYICQVHDIFQKSFHQEMFRSHQDNPQAALLASYEVDEYFPGGYLVIEGGTIKNIIEKPHPEKVPSNLVNIVAHIHPNLRRLLERVKAEYTSDKPGDDHYERAMATLMPEMTFKPVPYNGAWHPIKYPWHVLEAMHYFLSSLEPNVSPEARIEEGVNISGPVHIEAGVRILHGADIRGPVYIGKRCLIGQNAIVRDSMISEDTIVGAKSEINRSYLGRGTRSHDAMILDTVVADSGENGQHTNLSARMVTANFRADGGPIKSTVKGERINTGRTKFGAVIGAGSFIGIGVETMPGIKIGENCFVGASTLVTEDIPDNSRYYVVQAYVRKEMRPEKS